MQLVLLCLGEGFYFHVVVVYYTAHIVNVLYDYVAFKDFNFSAVHKDRKFFMSLRM